MTTLQNLLVALANTDMFQMTVVISVERFSADFDL